MISDRIDIFRWFDDYRLNSFINLEGMTNIYGKYD